MGCWNHTCMISNMHVRDDEEVVSLFLVQPNWHHRMDQSLCYSTAYYLPIPILLYGKYNDHGAVHEFTGQFDDLLVDFIKKNVMELPLPSDDDDDQPNGDNAVTKDAITLESMYEFDHESRLFFPPFFNETDPLARRRVRHVVIKKSLFDTILNEFKIEEWNRKKGDYDIISYKDIAGAVEHDVRLIKKEITLSMMEDKHIFLYNSEMFLRQFKDQLTITEWLPNRYSEDRYPGPDILEVIKNYDTETAIAYMAEIIKFQWLARFISNSRISWLPQGSQGSQDQDLHPYEVLGQYMLDEAKREKKDIEGWEDEDEEENSVDNAA